MKFKNIYRIISLLIIVIMMAGCAKKAEDSSTDITPVSDQRETDQEVAAASVTPVAENSDTTATVTPAATEPDYASLLKNETGKTVIRRLPPSGGYDFTYLMVTQSGVSILCEPKNPPKEIIPDIVTFSHDHHRDPGFIARMTKDYPDTIMAIGDKKDLTSTTYKDVTMQGIAASHTEAGVNPDNPTMMMHAFDMDGMRIVYVGDVGQKQFTQEQIDTLGKVDIALVTLDNYPGWISVDNSIALMKQLNPQIIIPIKHQNFKFEEAIDQMNKVFPNKEVYDGEWAVSKDDLADGVQKIVVINQYK